MSDRKRRKSGRKRLTAEERANFARERRELIGKLIIQDDWEGAIVLEHIRGSQYLVRFPDGTEKFASHKKQKGKGNDGLTRDGWQLWEEK
jgi:hypothetical protein|tara:strand:+ start:1339 stop:1608 length:270 start_codon:yes stop_codon:yes gene_type:complete